MGIVDMIVERDQLRAENDQLRAERNVLFEALIRGRVPERSVPARSVAIKAAVNYWLGRESTFVGTDVLEAIEAYDKEKGEGDVV